MKRIVASVGAVVLGAASIQTSNAQFLGEGKAWTLSAALRGFYDDNVNTAHSNGTDTFGFEISPTIALNLPLDQTSLSLMYTYSYKYYEKRPSGLGSDHDDQTHTISARLMHAFSERTTVTLRDSFVIGQEPDVLAGPGGQNNAPFRISGDNIRNYAGASINHQVTPLFGLALGYNNSLYEYDAEIYSVPLDRMEHMISLDGRWNLANNTIFLVGYSFGAGRYTGDGLLGVYNPDGSIVANGDEIAIMSDSRNYNAHYGYIGAEHTFRPDLFGSIKVGASFRDHYNSIEEETVVGPYVEASLRYVYAQDSNIQIGVKHDRSATDRFDIDQADGSFTTDSETTVAYASITHAITPDLSGTLSGSFQNSTFNGGTSDGDSEQFYMLGASLAYNINRHIAATASYNFDLLESDNNGRSYDRNRVFLGLVFTY
jgi:hypothetical protein